MRRRSRATRDYFRAGAWLLLFVVFAPIASRADQLGDDTHFCDGKADAAYGEGSASQGIVHSSVFQPAFTSACARESGLLNYLSTGDQNGITQLTARARSFAGSDTPLSPAEKAQLEVSTRFWLSPVHQIPLYVNGWAIGYNLPCFSQQMKLTSLNLSLIYLAVIKAWNDPRLVADNAGLASCNAPILLSRRLDTGGATRVFQDFLAKENPEWLPYARGTAPNAWPVNAFSCLGTFEAGMVSCVRDYPGAIAYVGIADARANQLQTAQIQNVTKSFVAATTGGCTAAAGSAVLPPGTHPQQLPTGTRSAWVPATLGDWSSVSITDAPDPVGSSSKSYPICSFAYAFILQQWFEGFGGTTSGRVARTVVDYFTAALGTPAQTALTAAGYGPLPESVRQVALDGMTSVSYFRWTTAGV
ncbi:MAG: substrate-binding domain-containing protein [Actinomycetota bacterium]|nr:substrate-binding domain-containing protein [Actinomycetota bacterium]